MRKREASWWQRLLVPIRALAMSRACVADAVLGDDRFEPDDAIPVERRPLFPPSPIDHVTPGVDVTAVVANLTPPCVLYSMDGAWQDAAAQAWTKNAEAAGYTVSEYQWNDLEHGVIARVKVDGQWLDLTNDPHGDPGQVYVAPSELEAQAYREVCGASGAVGEADPWRPTAADPAAMSTRGRRELTTDPATGATRVPESWRGSVFGHGNQLGQEDPMQRALRELPDFFGPWDLVPYGVSLDTLIGAARLADDNIRVPRMIAPATRQADQAVEHEGPEAERARTAVERAGKAMREQSEQVEAEFRAAADADAEQLSQRQAKDLAAEESLWETDHELTEEVLGDD